MKKVAIIGTHGLPARYGGFESLAEQLVESRSVEYTVFCSSCTSTNKKSHYKGAKLRYIPLKANGISSVLYDILSLCCAIRGYDAVLILGISGCIFIPIFRLLSRARIITNIDGLEHRRAKWGLLARWFLRLSERLAVRFSHTVVADNKAIAEYVVQSYGITPRVITYGGDNALCNIPLDKQCKILDNYGVTDGDFLLSICRIEPENNCHLILQAAAQSGQKLLFIGNWNRSKYSRNLRAQYANYKNIITLDAIYDNEVLYALRRAASCYIHGHSAGGTNPSLVEAMFLCRAIVAYDVNYNRETTLGKALYFSNLEHLTSILSEPLTENTELKMAAEKHYLWDDIRALYESLY